MIELERDDEVPIKNIILTNMPPIVKAFRHKESKMNTHKFAYKVVMLAMVFGLLAAPVAFAAEDKDDNPLYNIPLPSDDDHQYLAESGYGEEFEATAALSEEEKPVIIRDFNMELVGPQWERVPGKNE